MRTFRWWLSDLLARWSEAIEPRVEGNIQDIVESAPTSGNFIETIMDRNAYFLHVAAPTIGQGVAEK